MRALVGAIITAASLIAVGLTAIGVGLRYQHAYENNIDVRHIDHALMALIGLEVVMLLIGLATTFVGLMYHHHRRHHEHLLAIGKHPAHLGHTTPSATVP